MFLWVLHCIINVLFCHHRGGFSPCTCFAQLLSSNVAGYVYVEDVDLNKGTVTFRTPAPGPLPGLYWLAGSIKVILS